ncbi:lasso peptide biosynthesis B2 protein [Actinomadura fibrosa]|uniref:Lasso peptide biosynthesis B2 protein n=1 Tax=Actinomadura fibrosa TaxID=111802 RepID=A0ABW2XW72_9ACTN|nr:lasso peptide biosynthesis B2 protein [Actinomadura fibrosa]
MRPRVRVRLAVGAGACLARLKPRRIEKVLAFASRGARPATRDEAEALLSDVLAASLRSHGTEACLRRSLAVVLLGRTRGVWPTWCVGVLTAPPFMAHAWVEAGGVMIGERAGAAFYGRLISVGPPRPPAPRRRPPVSEDRSATARAGETARTPSDHAERR